MSGTRLLVAVAALAIAVVGVWRGTWAVGGSDSSCYALMATAFARGELQPTTSLAGAPWPDAPRTFAPGGFVPSPHHPDAASPVCTPGFSLLLAPLRALGGREAIFLFTPAAGALLVWLTFLYGRGVAGSGVGASAALVVAAAPVFVFQVVQPMNDVAAAAASMAIVVLAVRPQDHSGWIGALTGLAILIRPNLAPAAIVVAAWCLRGGVWRFTRFGLAAAPFVAVAGLFNALLYGHPLQSGYGSAADLFSASHVAANVQHYGRALFETQLGFPLLGMLAAAVAPAHVRRLLWLPLGLTASVVLVYLFYQPFPEWWYLRFLLPVLPMMTVLAMAALVFALRRPAVVWPAAAILVAFSLTTEGMAQALDLHRLERRFRTVGAIAREALPANAVFITVWNSGSVRYHADREAILWDAMDPPWLDPAVAWLSARGLEPHLVIEEWEEPAFRDRFAGHSALADLDWPPRYRIPPSVRIYRAGDRDRHLAGELIRTEYVR